MEEKGVSYSGVVGHGEGSGAKLNFPTANIPLTDKNVSGIYAGLVTVGESIFKSAVYANTRRGILEAHLLGFSGTLYGKVITITLVYKIREDKAFQSFPNERVLSETIAGDVRAVRTYFENKGT